MWIVINVDSIKSRHLLDQLHHADHVPSLAPSAALGGGIVNLRPVVVRPRWRRECEAESGDQSPCAGWHGCAETAGGVISSARMADQSRSMIGTPGAKWSTDEVSRSRFSLQPLI